jgi:hypothetical protein
MGRRLAALPGHDPCNDVGAVFDGGAGVESAVLAGDALNQQAGVLVYEDSL